MVHPGHLTPDALSACEPVTQVTAPIRPDRRLVSVEEGRISLAALTLLGDIEGLSRSAEPIAKFVLRQLAPTANRLAQELLAAGHDVPPRGEA